MKDATYEGSYYGFRLYCTKQPTHKETIVEQEDGRYRMTEFFKGHYIAVHKKLGRLECDGRDNMMAKIEIVRMEAYFNS